MKRRTGNINSRSNRIGAVDNEVIGSFREVENIAIKIFEMFDKGAENIVSSFAEAFGYVQQMVSLMKTVQNATSVFGTILSLFPGGDVIAGLIEGGGKASGGNVISSMPYVVGEQGPEVFIPDVNGFIIPNSTMEMLSDVNNNFSRDRYFADAVSGNSSLPNITVIVQSEVERTKAMKFFNNHFPDFETRRGKGELS